MYPVEPHGVEEVALAEDARVAEVAQLDVPRVGGAGRRLRRRRDAEHVLGLDVAVDDAERVEALDRREELAHDRHRLGLGELRAQRGVVHELAAVHRLREDEHPLAEPLVAEVLHDVLVLPASAHSWHSLSYCRIAHALIRSASSTFTAIRSPDSGSASYTQPNAPERARRQ